MNNIIVFNNTHKGASHDKSGLPCQDYSVSHAAEDGSLYVSIVCDGHGGTTYVRSDRGSKFAATITIEAIKDFVKNVDSSLFIGNEGAVTARPGNTDDLFGSSVSDKQTNNSDLSESQQQQIKQNEDFVKQVENIKEQDNTLVSLFAYIYESWLSVIQDDAKKNPFTEDELTKLGGKQIVKAYGTTLMVYVRTKLYWFAFHIGDGKCLAFDYNLKWRTPIPWDCNCFLNVTTSLCASNPIPSFRYCFNGKGEFPAAIIMGSDGLDDSWVTMDNLAKFYAQVLNIASSSGLDSLMSELNEYLPKLSQKGRRDDMSVAGVIDLEAIKGGLKLHELKVEANKLTSERQAYLEQEKFLTEKLDKASTALEESSKHKAVIDTERKNIFDIFTKKNTELDEKNERLEEENKKLREQVELIETELAGVKKTSDIETERIDVEIDKLKAKHKDIEVENNKNKEADLQIWQCYINNINEQSSIKLKQERIKQSEKMNENSSEWSATIDKLNQAKIEQSERMNENSSELSTTMDKEDSQN